ncbi:MAG: hypothetical protein AB7I50_14275, partial [Vicinamibacterales bacterium]
PCHRGLARRSLEEATMSMEQNLRRLFARKPAPPGFAARVLARAEREDQPDAHLAPRASIFRVRPTWWLAGAAAALALTVGGMYYAASRRDAVEAERVWHEVNLALHITVQKLAMVQGKLQ